jgi:hypothetical protein
VTGGERGQGSGRLRNPIPCHMLIFPPFEALTQESQGRWAGAGFMVIGFRIANPARFGL